MIGGGLGGAIDGGGTGALQGAGIGLAYGSSGIGSDISTGATDNIKKMFGGGNTGNDGSIGNPSTGSIMNGWSSGFIKRSPSLF